MKPTYDQIQSSLEHVHYEIESFLQSPEYDPKNSALEESVYFRKMAHCRALHDFFKTAANNRKQDDIVSGDFKIWYS